MSASTERRIKRWQEQRWLLDSVVQAIGLEWDPFEEARKALSIPLQT